MIYVYIIKMNVKMYFFIVFGDARNYGYWAWTRLNGLELRKCKFELVYKIIVGFGMKHGYKVFMIILNPFMVVWI